MRSSGISRSSRRRSSIPYVRTVGRRCQTRSDFPMASAVFSLFQVDIRNLVRNRIYILKSSGLQPSEYASWPFYEYEFFIADLNEYIEAENKRNEESDSGNGDGGSIMRDAQKMMKSGMSSFKMPAMPKI